MMALLGRGPRRARLELEKALLAICDRLERLETVPPPSHTPQQIQATLELMRGGLDERLGVVDARMDGLESNIADAERRLAESESRIKTLTFGVEEGIQRTDRAERRIHATVKRARKELAVYGYESPGLEGEAAELHLVDGGGSEESEVPTLPTGVEPPIEASSSIKGVSAETLRRVRGW